MNDVSNTLQILGLPGNGEHVARTLHYYAVLSKLKPELSREDRNTIADYYTHESYGFDRCDECAYNKPVDAKATINRLMKNATTHEVETPAHRYGALLQIFEDSRMNTNGRCRGSHCFEGRVTYEGSDEYEYLSSFFNASQSLREKDYSGFITGWLLAMDYATKIIENT